MDELRAVLELATEEELQDLTAILFSRKFNPLDYVHTPEPIEVQSQDRQAWLNAIEDRFRFLAADGITVLRGRTDQVTYRQALIQVCKYLKIPYYEDLATVDLEAEVFLHLLGKVWKKLPKHEQQKIATKIQRQLLSSDVQKPLPLSLQKDPLGLIFKGGSALAVTSVIQPYVLQHIARQFAIHLATYQVAKEAAITGTQVASKQFQSYVTAQMARRGMTVSAARYSAVRSVFAVVGPMMWAWFFADLGWRAIATNYGRIIPTIFTLAQIRLTRAECWELA
ncbi:YaaW family protein [Sphaerospermopsis torques-reginae]|uniref:YaaW family protein n=1 Tax=Sphaerospermopsis torques-reginae ITEP-024 TaxID=984208 RepID=A0ABX8X073_9CYAN|nr:YaaW family protein [Sphaerospermopsis torques-reginae]QYX31953.1 YaaW family protein [Sphaerospermopsis torques-reginae ITEP-024]